MGAQAHRWLFVYSFLFWAARINMKKFVILLKVGTHAYFRWRVFFIYFSISIDLGIRLKLSSVGRHIGFLGIFLMCVGDRVSIVILIDLIAYHLAH